MIRTTRSSPLRLSLPSLCVALALAAAVPSGAQGAPRDPRFWPIGSYSLELDGERVAAEFFHSTGVGTILMHTAELSHWVELQPRGRLVTLLPPEAIHRNVDGTREKLPAPLGTPAGVFELVDKLPHFTVEGRAARLIKRPDLLGPSTADEIVGHDASYRVRADAYRPQGDYLQRLRQVQQPVLVKVIFGSWCSVCAELIPHVIKVEELLGDSSIRFEYHGVPNDFDDAEARRLGVTSTPTGIVYVDGEEIQRITGYSWRFPDLALHNALLQAGALR
ncbi:MAG TPA: thioredoxin family protein [Thermoanaerobaculia bacterium]|nr:thioredoxin family protein [Thermoanaerobaculia bacterium]